jgi:DNA-binding response OmpR family regulator
MSRVLLIEDDLAMQELICDYLESYGFETEAFEKPKAALSLLKKEHSAFDVIVLDLMLPQMDGFDVCKVIREVSDTPLIISSARGELSDKILAYECGADDYLAKPYEPRELIIRINAILRRASHNLERYGDFEVDEKRREIRLDGYLIDLTRIEYDLLLLLLRSQGSVLSREVLFNGIQGMDYATKERTIDMHISNIRQKIGDDPRHPRYIKSVWGIGYKFIGEM